MKYQDHLRRQLTPVGDEQFVRTHAVIITLPAPEERSAQYADYITLEQIGEELVNRKELSGIEFLYYHDDEQKLVITPQVSGATAPIQAHVKQSSFGEAARSTRQQLVRSVSQRAQEVLPNTYGVAVGSVNCQPLGHSPVWTVRVLLEENNDLIDNGFLGFNPVVKTLKRLADANLPYLLQTLLCDRDKMLISVRIAVFTQHKPAVTKRFFSTLLDDGQPIDIAQPWERAGFKTPLNIPIYDYWKQEFDTLVRKSANYRNVSYSSKVRGVYTGAAEYPELLRGRLTTPPGYEDCTPPMYGKIVTNTSKLNYFTPLWPNYESVDWDNVHGREPPAINKQVILREPAGRSQETQDNELSPQANSSTVQTDGQPEHSKGVSRIVQVLCQYKYQGREITQDTSSIPDGVMISGTTPSTKLDAISQLPAQAYTIEYESGNLSKPANILRNKHRALYWGVPTVFVVAEDSHVSALINVLLEPYSDKLPGRGVRLYTTADHISDSQDQTVLLPDGVTESNWILTTDGTLELVADDEIVAEGPADANVCTWSYDTPTYQVQDGTHYIIGSDGTVLDQSASDAVLDGWTKAKIPFVPVAHTYLTGSTVIHEDGTPFVELPLPFTDAATLLDDTDLQRQLLGDYIDAVLTPNEGETEYRGEIKQEFQSIFNQLKTPVFDETEWTDVDSLNDVWFGRAWPNNDSSAEQIWGDSDDKQIIETTKVHEQGKRVTKLQDYSYRYPAGIISPHSQFTEVSNRSVLSEQYQD